MAQFFDSPAFTHCPVTGDNRSIRRSFFHDPSTGLSDGGGETLPL